MELWGTNMKLTVIRSEVTGAKLLEWDAVMDGKAKGAKLFDLESARSAKARRSRNPAS